MLRQRIPAAYGPVAGPGDKPGPTPSYVPEGDDWVTLLMRLSSAIETQNRIAMATDVEIAAHEQEVAYNVNATQLVTVAKTTNIFVVEYIIAAIPTGATGTIALGEAIIPVTQQLTGLQAKLQLQPPELRQLTSTNAGVMALILMGHQRSPRALLH